MKNRIDQKAQDREADIPLLVICNSVAAANAMMHAPSAHVSAVLSQPWVITEPPKIAVRLADYQYRCGPRKLAKSLILCLEAHKNAKDPSIPMPSVRQVMDDNLGEDKELHDNPFQRVLESENFAMAVEAGEKGHNGDAPLKHPHQDTLVISKGRSRVPKLDTNPLATQPPSPAPTAGSMSPFSRTNSDTDKPVHKLLLVDDNKINLQLLVTYIKKAGHAFMTANDGLEALEAYKSQCEETGTSDQQVNPPFDYVLMDLSVS